MRRAAEEILRGERAAVQAETDLLKWVLSGGRWDVYGFVRNMWVKRERIGTRWLSHEQGQSTKTRTFFLIHIRALILAPGVSIDLKKAGSNFQLLRETCS